METYESLMEKIRKLTWTDSYFEYLKLRSKGLKKGAKLQMEKFINDARGVSKKEQRVFLDLVYQAGFYSNEYNKLIPQNLYLEIFLPTLKCWIVDEPTNFIPYRWAPALEMKLESINLNPHDQISIYQLGNQIIGLIEMNQHEIGAGYGYDGSPADDISLISFFEPFLQNILNEEVKESFMNQLSNLKNCAIKYL